MLKIFFYIRLVSLGYNPNTFGVSEGTTSRSQDPPSPSPTPRASTLHIPVETSNEGYAELLLTGRTKRRISTLGRFRYDQLRYYVEWRSVQRMSS
jgi:hypothetical protein